MSEKSDVVQEVKRSLEGIESLKGTKFSKLFHESRTTSDKYESVVCQVRVINEELETSEPVAEKNGQNLRGTDDWDGFVKLPIIPFMSTRNASNIIQDQLKKLERKYKR